MEIEKIINSSPVLRKVVDAQETVWINPNKIPFGSIKKSPLTMNDINDAEERLSRFAPFIKKCFPETVQSGGIIESPLTEIPKMKSLINEKYQSGLSGRLFLKQDSELPIAGSVKARGGIYEVLKHTEDLSIENGILSENDSYEKLACDEYRKFFSKYTIQVGSTGNLGLSIGIMSAAIGYNVIVHMSADAKQWKKDLLRSHGVTVKEYDSDYSEAVKNGRALSDSDSFSYFVDDENSKHLFLGYAVAAKRLAAQLKEKGVTVDGTHPLFVYIPCGVGGAPCGITFGLKQIFGDSVHCFFAEPVQAPCMLLGMASGLHSEISVQDIGLSGQTHADGLAVGRPSGFAGRITENLLSGEFTVEDSRLYDYMRDLLNTENIFIEPSACAAFHGPVRAVKDEDFRKYTDSLNLGNAVHIVWATGGRLVPENIREEYINTYL